MRQLTFRSRQGLPRFAFHAKAFAALAATVLQPAAWAMDDPIAPPPGLYFIGYAANYRIEGFKAPGSRDDIPGDNKSRASGVVGRLLWMSEQKILGADYGAEILVPVLQTSLNFGLLNFHDQRTGLSDIYVSPLILGWHSPRWDTVVGSGVWLDNGRKNVVADPGVGYKRYDFSAGANYYWDAGRSVTTSTLWRLELSGKDADGVRRGQQLFLDWGMNKRWGPLQAGVIGYSQWQLGNDEGAGMTDRRASRHALGAQISYIWLEPKILLKAAWYREVSVKAGNFVLPKGDTLRITFAKAF